MKRAFTLIELLIVIAIIAILALIAVPNFLEAQVRAKVSRAYADMRTIATSIETYAVDWGRPPIGTAEYRQDIYPGGMQADPNLIAYSTLTTPVSYLSSVPADPFVDRATYQNVTDGGYRKGKFYYYQSYTPGSKWAIGRNCASAGYTWCARCVGPARVVDNSFPMPGQMFTNRNLTVRYVYDPTNGTISNGYILWNNKGRHPIG